MLRALAVLLAASALAQDPGLEALKAKQARLKQTSATAEDRQKAMDARGAELREAIESVVADASKEVDFKRLSDDEATAQFPKFEKVSGRSKDGLVVRVDNAYTRELELAFQPVGGRLLKISWSFYKDGSFKVGQNPARGGPVIFQGKSYLDPKAVLDNRPAIKDGLLKLLVSSAE